MTIRLLMATLIALQVTFSTANAHQRSWPGKRLADTFPEAKDFVQKQANLNSSQVQWIEKNLGESIRTEDKSPIFYSSAAGWVVFLDATGGNGKIEMGIAITPNGEVANVVLLESSESKDIDSKQFLSQFNGKKANDKFKVGGDVKAPKGLEDTAQSIATSVRRGLLLAMASFNIGTKK